MMASPRETDSQGVCSSLIKHFDTFHYHAVGPATDYIANMAQFVQNRRPQYKGSVGFETERPSASFVIDVSLYQTWTLQRLVR
jgi:hypothetical protein